MKDWLSGTKSSAELARDLLKDQERVTFTSQSSGTEYHD